MTTTMATNGKLRKSLSDQIDRLDSILDSLAQGRVVLTQQTNVGIQASAREPHEPFKTSLFDAQSVLS